MEVKSVKTIDDEKFKRKLRKLLLEFDIKTGEHPDPAYVGFAIWEYFVDHTEMPHIASDETRTYLDDLFDGEREKEVLKSKKQ